MVHDTPVGALSIRDASEAERAALESLQRRSSDVWTAYRAQLAAHPEARHLAPAAGPNAAPVQFHAGARTYYETRGWR